MGSHVSKKKRSPCEEGDLKGLREKKRKLQKEMREMMCSRERGKSRGYERADAAMAFAIKEREWKRERKRLREEVKRVRKRLEEREERIRGMEDEMVGEKTEKEWQLLGTSLLVEQMKEENAMRDEAVEKWKKLYLAIKTQLDDLIDRALNQGDTHYWRAEEEDLMDELQRELKAKEETIEVLQAQLASSKLEESKKDREIDILRQSLRIMSSKKKTAYIATSLSKTLHL